VGPRQLSPEKMGEGGRRLKPHDSERKKNGDSESFADCQGVKESNSTVSGGGNSQKKMTSHKDKQRLRAFMGLGPYDGGSVKTSKRKRKVVHQKTKDKRRPNSLCWVKRAGKTYCGRKRGHC